MPSWVSSVTMTITAGAWTEPGEGARVAEQGEDASDALGGVANHLDREVAKHLKEGVVAKLRCVVAGPSCEDAMKVVAEIQSALSSGVPPRSIVEICVSLCSRRRVPVLESRSPSRWIPALCRREKVRSAQSANVVSAQSASRPLGELVRRCVRSAPFVQVLRSR